MSSHVFSVIFFELWYVDLGRFLLQMKAPGFMEAELWSNFKFHIGCNEETLIVMFYENANINGRNHHFDT